LRAAGYDAANLARWYGVPQVTDVAWVRPRPERPRRGLGGWIALLAAGEQVPVAALQPSPSRDERDALAALDIVTDDGTTLRPRARLLPWSDLVVASPPAEAFDISALNVAASLPPARTLWDVGCGAGLLTLVAARAGARVFASDVDAELVAWARLNAALNGVAAEFAVGDLLAPSAGEFDAVVFNAPLVRAPLAVADGAPRYSASPEGEALALRFVAGVRATDRILLHAQLTPAIEAALDERAQRAGVTSVVFAHAPDGTPHALTEIRVQAPAERRRVVVPLSPACPHLSRALFDGLWASRALADDATPLPAPWLELRTSERFDGGRRALAVSFGGAPVDAEDLALLDRLRGQPLGALGLDATARERLCAMIDRGHVILR
jgi:SAM-dependent methyltransferase